MHAVYEFGNYQLDPASRQLTRDGEAVPLTPKGFDLLQLMVESRGRALSRDELIRALWSDAFVEEANLSFQVSALRKALGDNGAAYIETLPRHGYRFNGSVARLELPQPPVVAEGRPPSVLGKSSNRETFFFKWYWTAALFGIAAVAAWMIYNNGRGEFAGLETAPLPLTSYPGYEIQPSLSPDGSQVAFSWDGPDRNNFDIYVKLVGPGEPVRLTKNPAMDQEPAWSPEGRSIAFLRYSTEHEAAIYLVPALGGTERKLATVTTPSFAYAGISNLTWTPDGKYLALGCVVGTSQPSSICLVSVDTGEQRRVTSALKRLGDYCPKFSPDRQWLAFLRAVGYSVGDVYVQRLTSELAAAGEPRRLTSDEAVLPGVAWASDGKALLYSVGRTCGTSSLRAIPFHPAGQSDRYNSRPASFGEGATALSISRNNRIVYARQFRDSNLWRVQLVGNQALEPVLFVASTLDDACPNYSVDGKRFAFASNRSGYQELWTANVDGSQATQLTDLRRPLITANPRWSPDGTMILFNSADQRQSDVYTIGVDGGTIERLTSSPENEVETRWSRDGKWIYYSSDKSGRFEIYKMPTRGGGMPVQLTHDGGINPNESPDGLRLYYAKDATSPTSIWTVPIAGGPEVKVLDGLSYSLNFAVANKGIYFLSVGDNPNVSSLEFYDLHTGNRARLRTIDKGWFFGMALSPDQRWLTYSVIDQAGSDLMMAQYSQ
jgi:Tol biopolymer transport system component/DNA-binding winged helix-turn-helix (wHTH) protein